MQSNKLPKICSSSILKSFVVVELELLDILVAKNTSKCHRKYFLAIGNPKNDETYVTLSCLLNIQKLIHNSPVTLKSNHSLGKFLSSFNSL